MSNLWDFFSHEAGQDRRRWLDGKMRDAGKALSYYIPPDVRPHASAAVELGGMFNPVNDIGDAMSAGRDGRYGDMVLHTAIAASPAVAGRVAKGVNPRLLDDTAEWLEDALMGFSVNPTRAALTETGQRFVADETGALNFGRRPDEYAGWHRAPGRDADNATLDAMDQIYPDDVYGPNSIRYYGHDGSRWEDATLHTIRKARGNPDAEIEVYRAVPKGQTDINAGDWVTPNRAYAEMHGDSWVDDGEYDILAEKVRAGDLYTDANSLHEFGWDPAPQLTPAQEQAQDVLDLLSAGRADEVTDDMLAKADDLYLFENYDLPMDEASRMARAEEMGLGGGGWFRGSRGDVDVFRENPEGRVFSTFGDPEGYPVSRAGTFFSDSSAFANDYSATFGTGYSAYHPDGAVVGEYAIPRRVQDLPHPYDIKDWAEDVGDADAYDEMRWANGGWEMLDDEQGQAVKRYAAAQPRPVDAYEFYEAQPSIFDDAIENEGQTAVVFNPTNIRSRFARFDPRLKHLSNLSAAAAGIGLLAPAFYSEQGQ